MFRKFVVLSITVMVFFSVLSAAYASECMKHPFPSFEQVRVLYFLNKYDEALHASLSVKEDDRNVCWYASTSQLCLEMGEFEKASELALVGKKRYPNNGGVLQLKLAKAYKEKGEYNNAILELDSALPYASDYYKKWIVDQKAILFTITGKYHDCKALYDDLILENPKNVNYILNSIYIEALLGNVGIATEKYETAEKLGFSNYGKCVGLSYLAFAYYYSTNTVKAKKTLDGLLSQKGNGHFKNEIGELSFLLNYRVEHTIGILAASDNPKASKLSQIYLSGLLGRVGQFGKIDDLKLKFNEFNMEEKSKFVEILVTLNLEGQIKFSEMLYILNPDNPYFNYLYGLALKNRNIEDCERFIQYASSKVPGNRQFISLLIHEVGPK